MIFLDLHCIYISQTVRYMYHATDTVMRKKGKRYLLVDVDVVCCFVVFVVVIV